MTYKRFEDLPVWKAAVQLLLAAYDLCEMADEALRKRSDLKSQFQRAALSISNNIAEGFERGTTKELIVFLYIARGSAGEVRSMLGLMELLPQMAPFQMQLTDLRSRSESISKQLYRWLDQLQNTSIKGQKFLNDAAREEYRREAEAIRAAQEKREFMDEIRQMVIETRGF